MKKGQKPSSHIRRIKTKKGIKRIRINPNIKKKVTRRMARFIPVSKGTQRPVKDKMGEEQSPLSIIPKKEKKPMQAVSAKLWSKSPEFTEAFLRQGEAANIDFDIRGAREFGDAKRRFDKGARAGKSRSINAKYAKKKISELNSILGNVETNDSPEEQERLIDESNQKLKTAMRLAKQSDNLELQNQIIELNDRFRDIEGDLTGSISLVLPGLKDKSSKFNDVRYKTFDDFKDYELSKIPKEQMSELLERQDDIIKDESLVTDPRVRAALFSPAKLTKYKQKKLAKQISENEEEIKENAIRIKALNERLNREKLTRPKMKQQVAEQAEQAKKDAEKESRRKIKKARLPPGISASDLYGIRKKYDEKILKKFDN